MRCSVFGQRPFCNDLKWHYALAPGATPDRVSLLRDQSASNNAEN
jgi:hypothetical protein